MDLLKDMAIYVEVVRTMSFSKAAEALGMPASTVSRRVATLENNLGLRLLHRTTRTMDLTAEGSVYYERCRRIVQEARAAHEELTQMQSQVTGVIRASLPADSGALVFAPYIADFVRQYPGISFDFDLSPKMTNLVSEPFDVAIRIGKQSDSNLIARQITKFNVSPYASPAYLAASGTLQTPDDLKRHQCLPMPGSTWTLTSGAKTVSVPVTGPIRMNNIDLSRHFALLGMGIAVLLDEQVAEDVRSGRLARVLPEWTADRVPVYAVTETKLLPAKTRLFIDFLVQRF